MDAGSANADAGSRGSQDKEFSFVQELEEYKGMVKDMDLTDVQDGLKADLLLVTLEGTVFKLDWSVNGGMKIVATGEAGGALDENPSDK